MLYQCDSSGPDKGGFPARVKKWKEKGTVGVREVTESA